MPVQEATGASLLVVQSIPPLVEMKTELLPKTTMAARTASEEQASCRAVALFGAGKEVQFVPELLEIQVWFGTAPATMILLPLAETATAAPKKLWECQVAP
jgi:hypothetical protein